MHLVDELVGRVREVAHGFGVGLAVGAGRVGPCPGTSISIALDSDVLGCGACGADAVDGGLIELGDEGAGHVMILSYTLERSSFRACELTHLIVGIEDDLRVVLECGRNVSPECAEVTRACDDLVIVSTVVVRNNQGIGPLFGDVVDLITSDDVDPVCCNHLNPTVSVRFPRYAESNVAVIED